MTQQTKMKQDATFECRIFLFVLYGWAIHLGDYTHIQFWYEGLNLDLNQNGFEK